MRTTGQRTHSIDHRSFLRYLMASQATDSLIRRDPDPSGVLGRSALEQRYLHLLKQALTFDLWPEPPVPIEAFNYMRTSGLKRSVIGAATRLLGKLDLQVVRRRSFTAEEREEGRIWPWPGYADTMIGWKRLDNLHECVEVVIREGVEGDLIETGVWRGGACILMRGVLLAHGVDDRRVFVADSFEGLPKPELERYSFDEGDTHHTHSVLAVSEEDVRRNFEKYGLLDDQVVFLKGWFKDTLPSAPIEKLALMRLDGDMYSSTMDALVNLYPKLSAGGFCIIDDYALTGCKQAVDDFRRERGIEAVMREVDWSGVYWRKEESEALRTAG